MASAGTFCVNVLGIDHGDLCWRFAKSSIEEPVRGRRLDTVARHRLADPRRRDRVDGLHDRARSSTPAITSS